MRAVACGAGTNSFGVLIGMHEHGVRPDVILFADTIAEKPHTYRARDILNEWCVAVGFPAIVTVVQKKRDGSINGLEQLCLDKHMLPSLAYGYKTCSQKHKIAPQDKWMNHNEQARAIWRAGDSVIKVIGYDADEERRAKLFMSDDKKYIFEYPLINWGWGRDECIAAIERAGLPLPGKSACFFCPSSTKKEILELRDQYPELASRAVAMEKNADLDVIKGLGRRFSWADVYAGNPIPHGSDTEISCGCYDGASD